jgi:LacI family transcriptional regulator
MVRKHLEVIEGEKITMVTIRDVAQRSGFSATTVSIVLNNSPAAAGIPAATKKRIESVARQMSYRPNPFARMLLSNRSRSIAVMVPDIADPYCNQLLRGIEDGLFKAGYMLVLADIQNHRSRFKSYLNRLRDQRVEGIISIANSMYLPISVLGEFVHGGIPTVIIGRKPEKSSLSSVTVDNTGGAHEALMHLAGAGHRKVAFIRGPKQLADTDERWDGICMAAKEVGLSIDSDLVWGLAEPASTYEGGYKATQAFIRSKRAFSAIMAFDDMTAFGAIVALRDSGRMVPEDCSVIGFDDVAAAAFYNPPLTTMRQPMEDLGAISVDILLKHYGSTYGTSPRAPVPPVRRVVKPELVVRKSTRAL